MDLRLVIKVDRHHGEARFRGFCLIDGQPFCVAFTVRAGTVRPRSLRRAHPKEFERYVGQ